MMTTTLQSATIASPLGNILVVANGEQICSLDYEDYRQRMMKLLQRRYRAFQLVPVSNPCEINNYLEAYFAGDSACLDSIPVNTGGTAFQQEVWQALRTIPPGTTTSYGELAGKLGRPTAYRAVGGANALNPIAIIIPCHRVIGANTTLTGYAGGLERKEWLLRHEKIHAGAATGLIRSA